MVIKNGLVFTEDKRFEKKTVYIENGLFVTEAEWEKIHFQDGDSEEVDASGCYLIPGLVDVHSHGAMGHDFSDGSADGLAEILRYQYAHGITTYCPTTMSLPKEKLLQAFTSLKELSMLSPSSSAPMSFVPGVHMEGPFVDPEKRGAQKREYLLYPDVDFFKDCLDVAKSKISLLTLAPNLPGSIPFIKEFSNEITISLGHTNCDYDTAIAAIDVGGTHITHLFNAMAPLHHRNPGLIGAALDRDNVYVELIADGIHVHDAMIRNAFRMFPNRLCLISDSMRATGMPDGTYDLGEQNVHVTGTLATLSDGTIAGSATNLFECMCYAIQIGVPMEDAIAAATITPAKSIGLYDKLGSVSPGKRADLLMLNQKMELLRIF
ncbi:MAG: N-acetylglucosamine-6-phosphate deacetylase [Pararoseburia sp.]|nr:N-acetylglucosamine-6-phosphate deacetylase [Lachnospiraceae bacterium]MDY4793646.1 N-acetylglucosamine-6-phosphate deacetylase [Pararoseburia sp.]